MPVVVTCLLVVASVLSGCYQLVTESREERPAATRGSGRSPRTVTVPEVTDVDVPERLPEPATKPEPATEREPEPEAQGNSDLRWVLASELENARDLGGTPVADGREVAHGKLFRGPPLAMLSARGCEEVEEIGIRTVLDLRIESERLSKPEAPCVEDGTDVVPTPLPVPYNVSPRDYIAILDTSASIAAIFDRLGDESAYPIYLHCTWGRDRTGVLAAVILRALGSSRAEIMQEYLLSRGSVGAYPVSLEAALDWIDEAGGIEDYLASVGVTDDQLSTLRSQALAPR